MRLAPAPDAPSVAQALAQAAALGLDRLDAQLLLAHHLSQSRAWLIAHDDAHVPARRAQAFAADCRRRADDWPIDYLLGQREFHGLVLQLTPDVLVPRPDTETLVDWALELLEAMLTRMATVPAPGSPLHAPEVLDLGTGSGAIALALAQSMASADCRPITQPLVQPISERIARPAARHVTGVPLGAHITATELSPAALRVAEANARRLALEVEFRAGSWWQAVADRRFDLVLANPPYIAQGDAHLAALRHEPMLALTAGVDGLDALRAIVAGAPHHMHPGAWLLLEHGWDQADAVAQLLHAAGFTGAATRHDLAGRPRCTGAQWTRSR